MHLTLQELNQEAYEMIKNSVLEGYELARTEYDSISSSSCFAQFGKSPVAYRMLHEEDARMYDVRNRLRRTSIETTEQIYEHFQRR